MNITKSFLFIIFLLGSTSSLASISFMVHVERDGDVYANSGDWTTSRRHEGMKLRLNKSYPGVSVEYMCHLEGIGDVNKSEGEYCGTKDESRRLEAFSIKLKGANAGNYSVRYQCDSEFSQWRRNRGKNRVYKDGELCGVKGKKAELVGIRVWITDASSPIPSVKHKSKPSKSQYNVSKTVRFDCVDNKGSRAGSVDITGQAANCALAQEAINKEISRRGGDACYLSGNAITRYKRTKAKQNITYGICSD
jgi:hypothetical protein